MKTTVTTTFPRLVFVDDYHEFRNVQDVLQQVLGEQVIVEEVGYTNRVYVGIASVNEPASDEELRDLLQANKIELGVDPA